MPAAGPVWCWQRRIASGQQEHWIARLRALGCATWTFTERPDRVRVLLAVYTDNRNEVVLLRHRLGGRIRSVKDNEWIKSGPTPPTWIGRRLEIIHEQARSPKSGQVLPRLHIPHALAFGSGDHATTYMLLRALTLHPHWGTVLDLGTGSGVLALAARLFGAKKISATDFDVAAIRTARQNELLNFPKPLVRWRRGDVKRLSTSVRYDLVLANLFSGILCEAAPQIAASVAPGGQLWLSGVLRSQHNDVGAAYRRQQLKLVRTVSRGKWVMLQWVS